MLTYMPHFNPARDCRIDIGKTIRPSMPPLSMCTPDACMWESTIRPAYGAIRIKKRMHSYMEKKIRGVRYKVYSFYVGDADFRELYEKCLARRILKARGEGCGGAAAGD